MPEQFGDKTQEATPYRRQKAREEGQVVRSQDLASAALLVGATLVLMYFGHGVGPLPGRSDARATGERGLAADRRADGCAGLEFRPGAARLDPAAVPRPADVAGHRHAIWAKSACCFCLRNWRLT